AETALVTSVEADHLDHYGGLAALEAAFDRFLAQAPGPRVACADDPRAAALGRAHGATTYGTAAEADFRMTEVSGSREGVRFVLERGGRPLAEVVVPVPGRHNAANACAALVAGLALGASVEQGVAALARFGGVARRFQHRGESGGVTYVDDYAHLPSEVAAALEAAAEGGWRRVVCVFQPHRYSRTAALGADFGTAFEGAEVLVVTDVYGAGEPPRRGVSGQLVVDAVLGADPYRRVAYLPDRQNLVAYLRRLLRPGDLCLSLGAGDLTTLADELLAPPGVVGAASASRAVTGEATAGRAPAQAPEGTAAEGTAPGGAAPKSTTPERR
ncbi:MAG: hypothetical protein LC713_01015, partial [Actinobacteria bacterium]|nr:hypothetical protein [Actinomycetota bacterium]